MPHLMRCSVCNANINSKNFYKHFKKMHPEKSLQKKSKSVSKVSTDFRSKTKKEFVDYREYINSPEWGIKATEAKQRAGYKCQLCNRSSREVVLHVHHRTYERLGHEEPTDLTVLCKDCHLLFESLSSHRPSENNRLKTCYQTLTKI